MHGDYAKSTSPKLWFMACHLASLVFTTWILFASHAVVRVTEVFPLEVTHTPSARKYALLICSIIYFGRLSVTEFILLRRAARWDEAIGISLLLFLLNPAFAILLLASDPISWITLLIGLFLYGVGSFLNTCSALQRHGWKKRHPGVLYTAGFFRCSMHINYFGDIVLFTGFALVAGSWFALIIPLLMGIFFAIYHLPKLDRYLATKYGDNFRQWEARTARLIPFVY